MTQNPPQRVLVQPLTRGKRLVSGWIAAFMLTLMMVLSWADKSLLGLAAKPIMQDLGLTPTQFGAIGSAFFVIFCITPLVVGFIGNRVSSQWLLAVIVLLWSVAQAPVVLSASFGSLMVSRIILGAAEGPSTSLMFHHLYKWFKPSERAMPGAVASSGSTLGLAIAAPVLAMIIATISWQAAFGFMGLVGLVWVLIWAFVGKDGPLKTYDAAETRTTEPSVEEKKVPYWRIFTTRTWLGGLLGSHFSFWMLTFYVTWLPAYLQTALGLDLREAGVIAGIPAAIGFVAFIVSGLIVDTAARKGISMRWSVGVQIGITAVASGLCLLASMATGDQTAKIILLSLAFGLPNGNLSLVFLSAGRISPVRQRAAVFAFTNVGFTAAGIIVPLFVGVLIQQAANQIAGFEQAFLILGLALVAVGILAALMINPERDAIKLGFKVEAPPEPQASSSEEEKVSVK